MRRQDRPAEIYYYEWSVNRWRTSETRSLLSLAGRGLYRELLDLCYIQGSISADLKILASQVGCAPVEIEQIWPLIARHFQHDPHDKNRLRNKAADVYRKQYFGYISAQKVSGAVGGSSKARRMKEMSSDPASQEENRIEQNRHTAAVQLPQQQFGDWPETAKAIQEKYPDVDAMFVERLAIKCAAAHTSVEGSVCVFSDRLVADAIRQFKGRNQTSAGLYLTAIPNVITSWAKNGYEPEIDDGEVHF